MCAKRYLMPDPAVALTDRVIMDQVDPGSRVIDLGCGDGRLLAKFRDDRCCRVLGIELDVGAIRAAISRGVPVIHADLDRGLPDVPDRSFDVAVLSQTLQQVRLPRAVLNEMLRVARRALVVVPNFGNWKVRRQIMLQGRAPVTKALPYQWYETPNLHFMSMHDFRDLAGLLGLRIVRELPIINGRAVDRAWAANWRADSALYVLERTEV
jgi:methionine biosynthesis protein MetW